MQTDIVIIGGGLAGLSAARELSINDTIEIIILEPGKSKNNNPARLTFADTIKRFGLEAGIQKAYNIFCLCTVNGFESTHFLNDQPLVVIDYIKACDTYYSALAKRKNIKIIKARAEKVKYNSNDLELVLTNQDVINCKLLIDASGKKHFSLTHLNQMKPGLYSHSYGFLFDNCSHPDESICYFIAASKKYGSGGGWYYPYERKRASVGFAIVNNSTVFPARQLQKNFYAAINEFYPFSSYLKNAQPVKKEVGSIPIEHIDKMVYKRVLVVGDAAGLATPWMCMGVEPALLSGKIAGNVARMAIENNDYTENSLQPYQREWDQVFKEAYNKIKFNQQKIWFLADEVWDFLIKYDVAKLSNKQMLERIRYNKHLMSRFTALRRWMIYKYLSKKM